LVPGTTIGWPRVNGTVSAKRGFGKENKNTAIAEQALARFFFMVMWLDRLSKLEFHSRLVGKGHRILAG
jgi:hypothetical protein